MKLGFTGKLMLISAIVAVATYGLLQFISTTEGMWYWGTIVFYIALGLIVSRISQKSLHASNAAFYRGAMGAMGLRMILGIFFLAIYLIVSEIKATEFVIYYLALYLLFTIFEISQLVANLRPEK